MDKIFNKIPLSKGYHNFADKRTYLGIPNFFNIISNIAILIPAIYLITIQKKNSLLSNLLIIHIILLAIASTYYHLNPSDDTILWDIMMIATTSIIVLIMLTNHTDFKGLLLYLLGVFSIIYWKYEGDLRPYISILIGVPLYIIIKYYKNIDLRNYIYVIIIANILLRLSEHNDHTIYKITNNQISGHTLKHIFSGIGIWYLVKLLQKLKKI